MKNSKKNKSEQAEHTKPITNARKKNDKTKGVPIFVGKKETNDSIRKAKAKKVFFSKLRDKDSRKSIKLIFREFPAKMAKETSRIHWARQEGSLGKKFIITLIFIILTALFLFGVDELLHVILHAAHVIS